MEHTKIHFRDYQPMPRHLVISFILAALILVFVGLSLLFRNSDNNGYIPAIAGIVIFVLTIFFANKHRLELFKKYVVIDENSVFIKNGLFSNRIYNWDSFRSISLENFEPILFLQNGTAITLPMEYLQNKRFRKALIPKKRELGL